MPKSGVWSEINIFAGKTRLRERKKAARKAIPMAIDTPIHKWSIQCATVWRTFSMWTCNDENAMFSIKLSIHIESHISWAFVCIQFKTFHNKHTNSFRQSAWLSTEISFNTHSTEDTHSNIQIYSQVREYTTRLNVSIYVTLRDSSKLL